VSSLSIAGKDNGHEKNNQDSHQEILDFKKMKGSSMFLLADGHGKYG